MFDNFEKLSMLLRFSKDILERWARGCCMHVFLVWLIVSSFSPHVQYISDTSSLSILFLICAAVRRPSASFFKVPLLNQFYGSESLMF